MNIDWNNPIRTVVVYKDGEIVSKTETFHCYSSNTRVTWFTKLVQWLNSGNLLQ